MRCGCKMPNRIIRQGIIDSDRVNLLTWPEEVFYRRLLNVVDDHGLYELRIPKIRAALYPLKLATVKESNIVTWVDALVRARLIRLYIAKGKPYLQVLDTNWQIRSVPKYPPPEAVCEQLITFDNICQQLRSLVVVVDGDVDGDGGPNGPHVPPGKHSITTSRFNPPTLEAVKAHLSEKAIQIDAEHFLAHYTANGWVQSSGRPIKCWKSAVTTWQKNDKKINGHQAVTTSKRERV